jgi:hypothetical protein
MQKKITRTCSIWRQDHWLIHSFSLSFFFLSFFLFYEFIFLVFLVTYLPSFLLLSLYLSLFYAFIWRFHHLRFYEARDCVHWITCYVGSWRKNSCPCYKLISARKWTRTGYIRENISEVERLNWDSKSLFLLCRIYVIFITFTYK